MTTSARDDQEKQEVMTSPSIPSNRIAQSMQVMVCFRILVSAKSVKRRLVDDFRLSARRPRKKPIAEVERISTRRNYNRRTQFKTFV